MPPAMAAITNHLADTKSGVKNAAWFRKEKAVELEPVDLWMRACALFRAFFKHLKSY